MINIFKKPIAKYRTKVLVKDIYRSKEGHLVVKLETEDGKIHTLLKDDSIIIDQYENT